MKKFMSNMLKYLKNIHRVSKLRHRGATIGKNVVISENCTFDNPQNLKIGDNVYIGNNFYSNCIGGLTIESGTIISYNCTIMTYNHDYTEDLFMPYGLANIYREVVIKRHVWIGINVNINSGVVIGENAIIGMGTTVPKSIPEGSIYAGSRIIKEREPKDYKYDLLEVRAPYNPINLMKFKKIIKKMFKNSKNNKISFKSINNKYSKFDCLNMIFRFCEENKNYIVDWKNECIEYKK